MKSLLIDLFLASQFSMEELHADALFFFPNEIQQVEYYLVYFIPMDQLGTYSDSEGFKSALEAFQQKRVDLSDIDKNTSLILCVHMEEFRSDCPRFKYDILKVEENEFQFKNYVLPYTNAALTAFTSRRNLLEDLNNKVNNTSSFEHYFVDPFEDQAYFLAIQLFLKLPFLGPSSTLENLFRPIEQIVEQSMSSGALQPLYEMVISDRFANINWESTQRDALNTDSDNFDTFLSNLSS